MSSTRDRPPMMEARSERSSGSGRRVQGSSWLHGPPSGGSIITPGCTSTFARASAASWRTNASWCSTCGGQSRASGGATMGDVCRASIIVNSYNYARYVGQAIDSALGQTYPHTEVVVVDDGSTDGSRAVLAGYGGRVRAVLKDNGGQASAFNAGLRASRGEVVVFLDSDDALLPTAVARAVEVFRDPAVAKVHWPLWEIDMKGRKTGTVWPFWGELAEGDVRDQVIRGGPLAYLWPPTTGNAWARRFLESILPVPEADYRTCPDLYLSTLAPLFGSIGRVREPQGFWRWHGQNRSWSDPIEQRLRVLLGRMDRCCDALSEWCLRMGLDVDVEAYRADWKAQPLLQWLQETKRMREEI